MRESGLLQGLAARLEHTVGAKLVGIKTPLKGSCTVIIGTETSRSICIVIQYAGHGYANTGHR
jgi:hypothetical protein